MNKLKEFYSKREEKDLDKWIHYFDIYDKHLKRFSVRPINMLEIGVFKGGSVKMWSDYFGKRGTIYGMDIAAGAIIHNNNNNIKIIIGDQADKEFLDKFLKEVPKFDVVIDDGGHTATQQINSFEAIYPQMAQDGIYIVEDTHTSYMTEYQDLGPEVTFIEYTKKLIDQMHDWWRCPGASASQLITRYTLGDVELDELKMEVSDFCRMTQSIHIYDSMVIFEKGVRSHQVRDNIISHL